MKLLIKSKEKKQDKPKSKISPDHYIPHYIDLAAADVPNVCLTTTVAESLRAFVPILQKDSSQWELVYSMDQDGVSMNTLMRKCADIMNPCVLVIRDEKNTIFGAFMSESLHYQSGFYGNGTTFLWKLKENGIKVYLTTGENENYIISENKGQKFLAFGASDGKFGLWIDESMLNGFSGPCSTFSNETLSASEKFTIAQLEVWRIMF